MSRRISFFALLAAGCSIAAEPRNDAGDVDWPFRRENDFFYLTGIAQTGSTLVMIPGADKLSRDPLLKATLLP